MVVLGLIFKKILKLMKWFFIISIVSVIVFRFIPIPMTPTMLYLLGEQIFDSERKIVLKKDWESLAHISPDMKLAVIAAEDQLFYEHYGLTSPLSRRPFGIMRKEENSKAAAPFPNKQLKMLFYYHIEVISARV